MLSALLAVFTPLAGWGLVGLAVLGAALWWNRRRKPWAPWMAAAGVLGVVIGYVDLFFANTDYTLSLFNVLILLGISGIPAVMTMGFMLFFTDNRCRQWRSRSRLNRKGKVDYARRKPARPRSWWTPTREILVIGLLFLLATFGGVTSGIFLVDWLVLGALAILILNRRQVVAFLTGAPTRPGRRKASLGGRKTRRVFE